MVLACCVEGGIVVISTCVVGVSEGGVVLTSVCVVSTRVLCSIVLAFWVEGVTVDTPVVGVVVAPSVVVAPKVELCDDSDVVSGWVGGSVVESVLCSVDWVVS